MAASEEAQEAPASKGGEVDAWPSPGPDADAVTASSAGIPDDAAAANSDDGPTPPPGGYDAILVGTGLIQSVLAAALSRAGRSVLHCDGADHYGEMEAALPLDRVVGWARDADGRAGDGGDDCQDADADADADVSPAASATWEGLAALEEGERIGPLLRPGGAAEARVHPPPIGPAAPPAMRRCVIDLTPSLLHAAGKAVDGLVRSGVAEYCEFKSAVAVHLLQEAGGGVRDGRGRGGGARRRRRRGAAQAEAEAEAVAEDMTKPAQKEDTATAAAEVPARGDPAPRLELARVPCSKGDVFQTKLLSPVEKRKLMKFLQLASDYAVAESSREGAAADGGGKVGAADGETASENGGEDPFGPVGGGAAAAAAPEELEEDTVKSLNERQLLQGRALTRPQNKAVEASGLDVLREHISRGTDFGTYLDAEHGLPPRLRTLVLHALALRAGDGTAPTGPAMSDLCRHLLSLGRYGGTAFLVPMYGAGELSQCFCRSSAVHGGTYLLRRPARAVVVAGDGGERAAGIVLGGEEVLPGGGGAGRQRGQDRVLRARRVVVPTGCLPRPAGAPPGRRRMLRRVGVLRGRVLAPHQPGEEQRHIVVVPPGTADLGNRNAVHGIVLDSSAGVAPDLLDGAPCTVLHLTTTVEGEEAEGGVLDRVAAAIVAAGAEPRNDGEGAEEEGGGPAKEVYSFTFSYELYDDDDDDGGGGDHGSGLEGLLVCRRGGQSITLEGAFQEAERLFREICPDEAFLARSTEMDELVRETAGGREDESDDEGMVLESAMGLIDGGDDDGGADGTGDNESDPSPGTDGGEAASSPTAEE